MKSLGDRLREVRRLVRIHMNWFAAALLGKDILTKEELAELTNYGKLSLDDTLDLPKKAYILGREQSQLKSTDYKKLNYEAVVDKAEHATFSPLETYVLEYVKLQAAEGIKGLATDIAAGAFDRLQASLGEVVTEATVRGIIKDKVALAVLEKQSSQKLASTLAKELKAGWVRDWNRVAETELHRAKQMGTAQSIANKVGIYRNSDGPDSLVSIVPNPDTCDDCDHHFLDKDGNPKVFPLSELLANGSNADPGVKHTRSGGLHNHWKTTVPPLHPRCGCRIVYVPAGMGWEKGKLQVVNEDDFVKSLKKAVDQSSMSATIKPPGPKSTQSAGSAAEGALNPPSISGVAAPGNTAGPGRPKGSGSVETGSSKQMMNCPFQGGEACEDADGDGAPSHEIGGEQMQRHLEAMNRGAKPTDPLAASALRNWQTDRAKNWSRSKPVEDTVKNHLSHGDIVDTYHIEKTDIGTNPRRVTIKDNGRALMKTNQQHADHILDSESWTEGVGTVEHGSHARNEVDAYHLMTSMFGENYCPPTTLRDHEGKVNSAQHWIEDSTQLDVHVSKNSEEGNWYKGLMGLAHPDRKDHVKEKLMDITVGDIIMNNNDRHSGNLMLQTDEDGKVTDVQAIDHGACFGHDMMGMKSAPLREMSRAGTKFKLSDEKLQKLSTTSFGDLRRAMPGKKDWQVGQAMLRMRYVQHLHETEGHIDSNHFGTDAFFANGKNDDGEVGPRFARMRTEGKTLFAWQQGFNEDKERRKLAHQKFEDFALDYVDSAAMDESHPDHHAAKMLAKDGVLMGPGAAENPAKHRKEGKHKDYEKTVRQHRAELAEKKEVGLQATVAPPRRTKQAAEDVGLRSALRAPKVPKGV